MPKEGLAQQRCSESTGLNTVSPGEAVTTPFIALNTISNEFTGGNSLRIKKRKKKKEAGSFSTPYCVHVGRTPFSQNVLGAPHSPFNEDHQGPRGQRICWNPEFGQGQEQGWSQQTPWLGGKAGPVQTPNPGQRARQGTGRSVTGHVAEKGQSLRVTG